MTLPSPNPYLGEIRMFAGNFAPVGWMTCDGQELLISQYETLFNLLGIQYGGNGVDTFALPNLNGRIPIHVGMSSFGTNYYIAQTGGQASVALTTQQIPAHYHTATAGPSGDTINPAGAAWAGDADLAPFAAPGAITGQMNGQALQSAGNGQAHDNMTPYLAVTFIISLAGNFPSQT